VAIVAPDIPNTVIPVTDELIRAWLALEYRHRPSFIHFLQRLQAMEFKLMGDVNSVKIALFVTAIENEEM
jgi:hypothetical protein